MNASAMPPPIDPTVTIVHEGRSYTASYRLIGRDVHVYHHHQPGHIEHLANADMAAEARQALLELVRAGRGIPDASPAG